MAAKKTTRPSLIPGSRVLVSPAGLLFTSKQGRSLFFSLLLLLGFGLAIYFGWQQVSEKVLASSDYRIELEDIVISPPPPWVHSDIREDAFRTLSVEGPLSIMDDNIAKRFKDVFALHPWVERVTHASKHFPARIEVELVYRQPACIVATSRQWFPVDVKGYVLPWDDFSPSDLQSLPKVVGIDTLPVISAGAYWNDKQVDAAARIGAVLRPLWKELRLDTIQPTPAQLASRQKEVKSFELTTKGGTVILWGESPASKTRPEGHQMLSNQEKALKLKRYFDKHGTLDVPGVRQLDLRVTTTKVAGAFTK